MFEFLKGLSVPYRTIVTKELAELFGTLAHPQRIRIIEELLAGEKDVKTLAEVLGINSTGVSQHLSLLRAHRLISERKQGRSVFYRLRQPELAIWVLGGLPFAGPFQTDVQEFDSAVQKARSVWLSE